MAIEKISIEKFLELSGQGIVIDVRSPAEYKHAHIPGAISLPLFSDEERKIVGTAYKQQSRENAIKIGLDIFGPKMKAMVEQVENIFTGKSIPDLSPARQLFLYCWRGGMRSAGVAWLMDLYGFKVYTLAGGYKKFRNHILELFKYPFDFNIVGGYTGSGKTELLRSLKENGEHIIDLEGIAGHKGSAFGNIGLPAQPGQEMFENRLGLELKASMNKATWLEDESQRIGLVNIPPDLWKTMRRSPVYFVDIPFEERLKHVTSEYGVLDRQSLIDAIVRIREKLGGLNAKNAIQLLEEGNTIESFRILLEYYDKFYRKALHNRENINSLLHNIECNSVSLENANLLIQSSRKKPQAV